MQRGLALTNGEFIVDDKAKECKDKKFKVNASLNNDPQFSQFMKLFDYFSEKVLISVQMDFVHPNCTMWECNNGSKCNLTLINNNSSECKGVILAAC